MKVGLFLSSLWLLIASFFSAAEKASLTGTVKDGAGELLFGVSVTALKDRAVVSGVVTDINGKYRLELEPGTYQIEFAYTGFATKRITDVKVELGKENRIDMVLEGSAVLNEVVVTSRKERTESRGMGMGAAPTGASEGASEKSTSSARKKTAASPATKGKTAAKPAPAPPTDDAVKIKGSRTPATDYYIDGIRVGAEVPPVSEPSPVKRSEDKPASSAPEEAGESAKDFDFDMGTSMSATGRIGEKLDLKVKEMPSPGTITQPAPRAGLLTAGEWNDLHNWNHHWMDLLSDGEIEAYQKMYSIYPRQRYTVMLTNENDFPMVDAIVQLKGAGKVIWEARTDNTGKAELWAAMFAPTAETAKLSAEVWVKGVKHEIRSLKPAVEGFNTLKINDPCNAPKNVDIVWAVDATGSMGDEIEYLKTELLDVIGRAKSRNPELEYRMGTVFYRDKGDEYITKSSGLSPDIAKTVDFIKKQFAGGGGDYPEAVHSALEEAIYGQKWSENAVARICFLVLDASPHQEPDVIASIQKSIREAARMGIRIVPIAASGVQKDTEFLMKFFGLLTNGSYVFLTDHSGIGGKHLEPTTDEYKVEPLNDLLVRLISEYTSVKSCEGKSEIRFENDPQQQPGPVMQALYYPNPAVEQFTLELPFEVQSVTLYDAEGKAVRKVEKPVAGPNTVMVNDLAAGFYTIRILNNGLMQSGKLMVVRN